MSRCFTYPPPGYSVNQGSGQALIESIKLQREIELAKAESKKEQKREKKEKKERRKEKKERRKEKKGKSKSSLLPEKKIHKSSSTPLKSKSLQQLLQTETEQLERSSLTEEHAQPVELKPSTSSESTQNSCKRKREASPPAGAKQEENSLRSNGNVIRIRLSSQKQNHLVKQEPCSTSSERTVSPLQKQDAVISRPEPCSTSGRTELDTCNKDQGQVDVCSFQERSNNAAGVCPPKPETAVCSTSVPISVTRNENVAGISQLPEAVLPPRPDSKVCSTTSGGPKAIGIEDDISVRDPKSLSRKLVKAELRYRDLFSSWVPPPQMELACDDQDWLFSKKKNPDNLSEVMPKPISNLSCGSSSSSLWPRAQFIPEADIYALPFTVPF